MLSSTLKLTEQLINIPSITPNDNGCMQILADRLTPLGFSIEWFPYNHALSLWARRGQAAPLVCFAGHTDVVEAGPLNAWHSDPFQATVRDDYLYGRGAADMKSALAAFITSIEQFVAEYEHHSGSIALLITSTEEGVGDWGTPIVLNALQARGESIDYCLVGEPSSQNTLGDTIKNGRRGSLHGNLTVHGKQGHIAYPHHAHNPIHLAVPALTQLSETIWDKANNAFQASSFQISNINAGYGADNVIPKDLTCQFNFRFSPASTVAQLQAKTEAILKQHELDYTLNWHISGQPFFTTQDSTLIHACQTAIQHMTDQRAILSTDGGTSDGRFIAQYCPHVIEFGVVNKTIHQLNECVLIDDIEKLQQVYYQVLKQLLHNADN